uniref:Prion protein b n=1 Tax=Monopterus albus TaxID=43700 RepID=A0A3Q3K3D1_MONAL
MRPLLRVWLSSAWVMFLHSVLLCQGVRYPNQYPAAGGYPGAGGYPNQNPGTGGFSPGGYPVRGGNTGQGWGQPGANPGSYPGGAVGGGGGYGTGGSPFSNSVQSMGFQPKSSGFAKKAMMAAGVGALAGMAVGYGLGRFPRPHFSFRTPEEEYSYNNYMYRNYGSRSTDQKDFGHDYVNKLPPRAETYETLIDQVKSRRCVEEYIAYSKSFLEERKAEQHIQPTDCSSILSYGVIQLFTSLFMLLSSMFLLQ